MLYNSLALFSHNIIVLGELLSQDWCHFISEVQKEILSEDFSFETGSIAHNRLTLERGFSKKTRTNNAQN